MNQSKKTQISLRATALLTAASAVWVAIITALGLAIWYGVTIMIMGSAG